MKRSQLVSPGTIQRLMKAAEESWKAKKIPECLANLERATRLDPTNTMAHLQLGRIRGLQFDYPGAENAFDKAVKFAPKKSETLCLAGEFCRDFRDTTIASRFYNAALAQNDVSADIQARAAEFFERTRQTAEASRLVDIALQSSPSCARAALVRARLDRQARRLEEGEKRVRTLLEDPDRMLRAKAFYELGANLDLQHRYDEAMDAFRSAKSVLRLDADLAIHELTVIRERLRRDRETSTPDLFQRWSGAGAKLHPPLRIAFLGGHPRSGTTLLEQVLDSHPEIISGEETEVFLEDAYFPLARGHGEARMIPVLESASTEQLIQSRQKYLRQIERSCGEALGSRLLIDKNPSLTHYLPALVRVFPEMKIIVALRDPRDVCMSCFMQSFVPLTQGNAPFLSMEGTVNEYAALMGMWETIKPMLRNPWIEVRYEDMVENLESVSRRVLEFLGVPWDATVLRFNEHAQQKTVRSPTYADVAKPVFKTAVGRWRAYEKYLAPHMPVLQPFLKAYGYES